MWIGLWTIVGHITWSMYKFTRQFLKVNKHGKRKLRLHRCIFMLFNDMNNKWLNNNQYVFRLHWSMVRKWIYVISIWSWNHKNRLKYITKTSKLQPFVKVWWHCIVFRQCLAKNYSVVFRWRWKKLCSFMPRRNVHWATWGVD